MYKFMFDTIINENRRNYLAASIAGHNITGNYVAGSIPDLEN
jgi:hypothetical protein